MLFSHLIAWNEPQKCFELPLPHVLGKASHKNGPDFIGIVVACLGRILICSLWLSIGRLRLAVCWRRCLPCYRLCIGLERTKCDMR